MQVTAVQIAQSVAILSGYELTPARVAASELLESIKERYRFEKTPSPDTITSSGGAEFLGGRWESKYILKIALLIRGFAVQTQTDTEDSDVILSDLIEHSLRILDVPWPHSERRVYFSAFTFVCDVPILNPPHPAFEKLSADLAKLVGAGQPYEATSISLHVDDSNLKIPPGKFTIERRNAIPFSENSYISVAPLRTKDHQGLLQKLEMDLAKR